MKPIQNQNYFFEFTLLPPDWLSLLNAILVAKDMSANGLLRDERAVR